MIKLIPIADLVPHPDNPRLFLREDVVNGIAAQIRAHGFEERHAPHVRAVNGSYQIISGHQRTEAAKVADLDKIPCLVVEMTDAEAFRELLLSNAQSDLKPLEVGLHVLKTVAPSKGGRGKKGGISDYARWMGVAQQTMDRWTKAAKVAQTHPQWVGLLDYEMALAAIADTHVSLWPQLVEAMLRDNWTKAAAELRIETVNAFVIEPDLTEFFSLEAVVAEYLKDYEFSPATLARITNIIRRTFTVIAGAFDGEERMAEWREWFLAGGTSLWDARKLEKRLRQIVNEIERAESERFNSWVNTDWRLAIGELKDGSVSLLLTDPPYGMDYQSNYRLDRTQGPRHELIEGDNDQARAVAEVDACFAAFYSKLATDAHIFCFCHWSNEHLFRSAVERAGYQIRGSLIWVKNNTGMGDLIGTFAPKHERIIHAVKGSPMLWRREADVIECARVHDAIHPTEKPVELLAKLIEVTTVEKDLVADPFGGVASTLVAARQLKRTTWGCEVDAGYFAKGRARLAVL